MSTPHLVKAFYDQIWNAGDLSAADALLEETCTFRGSLGDELHGREAFKRYVQDVRGALTNYHCEILDCIVEGDRAFARMRFAGRHTGLFRGFDGTGKAVSWLGAAAFHFSADRISEVWVLGDLSGLDALLKENAER